VEEEKGLTAIEGTVDSIVYRNEENGYTVLRLDVGTEKPVTVVGCMPGAAPGEGLALRGEWGSHPSYGAQFKAQVADRRVPVGEKAIFDYLASGAVKGVGTATARRLVEEFGEDAFRVLSEEPEKLTQIKGITRKRAADISEAFRHQMGMRLMLDFLTRHQLPLTLAMPLYRRYGEKALDMVEENPYLLVDGELAVPFAQADHLALELGFEADHPWRLEAAVLYELRHNLNNGHSFLPGEKLARATAALLGLDSTQGVEEALDALTERGAVTWDQVAKVEACYLTEVYEAETYVAMRLTEMVRRELAPPEDLEAMIDTLELSQGITYAPQQRQAVLLAAQRQVMLLTGGPGTGKTTCLNGILTLFERLGLSTALTAPTGRAAKRMSETCGREAATIHRLLETQFDEHTGQLVFTHDEDDPLEYDAVIVDETSMVDITLMAALTAALRGDCRLILVGDPDQLPSVGPGNLLGDLLRSGMVPTVRLTEIFRQAAQSAIVTNAHAINRGSVPNLRDNTKDFFFLRRPDSARCAQTVVELVRKRLPEKMGIPADQIQVLSPTRKNQAGTYQLNQMLQEALNPPAEGKPEKRRGPYLFRLGDRVMQIKNNYDILWESTDGACAGMGVFNGDIGQITAIEGETVTVDFEGKLVTYSADVLPQLEPAYAMTVHKAQGSEYRAVILAVSDAPPMLLTRGVLYTAVTRARELLILVGDEGKVERMVENDRQTRRYSGLKWRLTHME